jgi:hypothetical protein
LTQQRWYYPTLLVRVMVVLQVVADYIA